MRLIRIPGKKTQRLPRVFHRTFRLRVLSVGPQNAGKRQTGVLQLQTEFPAKRPVLLRREGLRVAGGIPHLSAELRQTGERRTEHLFRCAIHHPQRFQFSGELFRSRERLPRFRSMFRLFGKTGQRGCVSLFSAPVLLHGFGKKIARHGAQRRGKFRRAPPSGFGEGFLHSREGLPHPAVGLLPVCRIRLPQFDKRFPGRKKSMNLFIGMEHAFRILHGFLRGFQVHGGVFSQRGGLLPQLILRSGELLHVGGGLHFPDQLLLPGGQFFESAAGIFLLRHGRKFEFLSASERIRRRRVRSSAGTQKDFAGAFQRLNQFRNRRLLMDGNRFQRFRKESRKDKKQSSHTQSHHGTLPRFSSASAFRMAASESSR